MRLGTVFRARVSAFATDCVSCGDMTPNAKRLLMAIVDEEIDKHRDGEGFRCWRAHTDEQGVPHTCLLTDEHDDDCVWTPDDDVAVALGYES